MFSAVGAFTLDLKIDVHILRENRQSRFSREMAYSRDFRVKIAFLDKKRDFPPHFHGQLWSLIRFGSVKNFASALF